MIALPTEPTSDDLATFLLLLILLELGQPHVGTTTAQPTRPRAHVQPEAYQATVQ